MRWGQWSLVAIAALVAGCEQLIGVSFNDAKLAPPPGCGDGTLNPGEACDDGNRIDADGCEADCTLPVCGNGIVDPGEVCDDGNAANGDACDVNCEPPRCGNSLVDPGELCFKPRVRTRAFAGSVGVADLDGDGAAEVVTRDNVWKWTGDGFVAAASLLGGGGISIATSDLNADGLRDLVVSRNDHPEAGVLIYENLGQLKFEKRGPFALGKNAFFVTAGPLTGSLPDICIVSFGPDALYVLRNLGGMEFELSPPIYSGEAPYGVVIADLDRDGDNDVAATHAVFSDPTQANVVVLRNDGGALTKASTALVAPGFGPNSIDAGDFDGDGFPDLMVANHGGSPGNDLWTSGSVTVLANEGSDAPASFAVAQDIPVETFSHFAVIHDIDVDGDRDIVAALRGTAEVAIISNDDGALTLTDKYSAGDCPRHLAVGDINGDGVPDIVTADAPDTFFWGDSCDFGLGGFTVLLSEP